MTFIFYSDKTIHYSRCITNFLEAKLKINVYLLKKNKIINYHIQIYLKLYRHNTLTSSKCYQNMDRTLQHMMRYLR